MALKRKGRFLCSLLGFAILLFCINVLMSNVMLLPKRLVHGLELSYGVRDAQFRRSMEGLMHNPIQPGNSAELLQKGEQIYDSMIEEINNAERTITFETYQFWGADSAAKVGEALANAARRGVRVHALIDYIGSYRADPAIFELMEEAGVQVIRYRGFSLATLTQINHRTHRKLLVVDGVTGFTGGANITDQWLPDENGVSHTDSHFRIQGPVVANMQGTFAENWLNGSGVLLEGEAYFPALQHHGDLEMQMIKSAPREGRKRVRSMLLYALAAAEENFTASTAYLYPDSAFLEALRLAAERGVRVRIVVPGDILEQGYVRHASINRWRGMLEAGVEIYEYQPSMYHSKLISVDDYWTTLGSANLDNRSFRFNDEANIAVYNQEFAIQVRELIEEDMQHSRQYTLDDWESRPWRGRIIGWIASAFGAYY